MVCTISVVFCTSYDRSAGGGESRISTSIQQYDGFSIGTYQRGITSNLKSNVWWPHTLQKYCRRFNQPVLEHKNVR